MSSFDTGCEKFIIFVFLPKISDLMVNGRGLMLLLLLGGDVSLNPGPFTLGVLNARSVRNKGPLLADMVASYDLDLLCLTETHIRPFDSDSFLRSVTPPDFNFPHKPRPSGIGGGVGFFIRSSYRPHIIETPCYQSFENIVRLQRFFGYSETKRFTSILEARKVNRIFENN